MIEFSSGSTAGERRGEVLVSIQSVDCEVEGPFGSPLGFFEFAQLGRQLGETRMGIGGTRVTPERRSQTLGGLFRRAVTAEFRSPDQSRAGRRVVR